MTAVLGFAVIAGTAAWIARVLFLLFLILFLISLVSRPRTCHTFLFLSHHMETQQ
ncbi:MAG TPA: DUF1328 domain-containing protein [Planctomycetaceae bacterium]|nr:DUF1328 domain-containing protein [Planctomycetaceae bacterium]